MKPHKLGEIIEDFSNQRMESHRDEELKYVGVDFSTYSIINIQTKTL